jgi:DNA-directed RNA polymerase subunit M/transcription elongation factor TFIIS
MPFNKIGTIFNASKLEILPSLDNWKEFRKQANTSASFVNEQQIKEAVDKEADFEVVASVNPDKFIYIHTTIMAGVTPEANGYWITPNTEKYINDNNDSWTCTDLLGDYKSFRRATTFVEHDQRLENARGKCIDAIARDMGDTILIDVLFSVDKRHTDLVANIESGIINAVSMGCSTAKTVCSICGNEATDPENYCSHVKQGNKGRVFVCTDSKKRKAAEICKGNTFFDVSLVANPAFAGAVFRKILSSSEVSNHLLANILNSKIESIVNNNEMILKAASVSDMVNISLKSNGNIEIKSGNQIYNAKEAMNEEEISSFKASLQSLNQPPKEEASKTMFSKILETVFGKKQAVHPIQNLSDMKDFSISDQRYEDIPYHNPHNVLPQMTVGVQSIEAPNTFTNPPPGKTPAPIELNILKPVMLRIIEIEEPKEKEEKAARVKEFKCLKCGYSEELWKIKAASVDAGLSESYECPNCFFIMESSLFEDFKYIHKSSNIWFKQWQDINPVLNFKEAKIDDRNFILATDNGKIVLAFDKEANEIHSDYDLNTLEKVNNILIASKDIPVDKDEDCFWFDADGNSVISKGEKFSFITTVDDGEGGKYGLFRTSKGEDFFMPMAYVNNNNVLDLVAKEEEKEEVKPDLKNEKK